MLSSILKYSLLICIIIEDVYSFRKAPHVFLCVMDSLEDCCQGDEQQIQNTLKSVSTALLHACPGTCAPSSAADCTSDVIQDVCEKIVTSTSGDICTVMVREYYKYEHCITFNTGTLQLRLFSIVLDNTIFFTSCNLNRHGLAMTHLLKHEFSKGIVIEALTSLETSYFKNPSFSHIFPKWNGLREVYWYMVYNWVVYPPYVLMIIRNFAFVYLKSLFCYWKPLLKVVVYFSIKQQMSQF